MSEVASEGMTFDQAKSEIQSAVQNDPGFNPNAPSEPLPDVRNEPQSDQADQPTPGDVPQPGATEFASADAPEDSFMGGDFNPDLLPAELQPGWKQLQGAFTKKTQELAEQRKQFDAYGDPEMVRQAADLYQSLQDPEYLKAFYSELGGVVRELGFEEPAGPEAQPVEEPVAPLPTELSQLASDDPSMAPLVERLASMERELTGFRESAAQERQAMDEERLLMAQANEIDRQVQVVREQHPDYGEDDWQAIYDRAVAFDGNVLHAAELYEADRDRLIQSYLSQKPVPQSVTPTPGAGTVVEDGEERPMTLAEAQKAAEAYLAANDLSEFTG